MLKQLLYTTFLLTSFPILIYAQSEGTGNLHIEVNKMAEDVEFQEKYIIKVSQLNNKEKVLNIKQFMNDNFPNMISHVCFISPFFIIHIDGYKKKKKAKKAKKIIEKEFNCFTEIMKNEP